MLTRVKAIRLEKGYTQMEVVERTRGIVNQYRLSVIERGVPPRPDEAVALAFSLNISPEDLWGSPQE
jgi:hypothetical protein